jgi:cyanophycin synthetase
MHSRPMSHRDIKFLRILHLRGPNIWTYRPVLEAWIDIGALEDCPSNKIPGLYERLSAWLPSLAEHRCSYGERGGFLRRLKEGTWPGHILEHVALELENLAGLPARFGKTRATSQLGVYKIIIRAEHERITQEALEAARDLLLAAIDGRPFDVGCVLESLRDQIDALCLGPSTAAIVDAADDRGIPAIRLSERNLVQLGYGARQHRIWTAETDRTSAIAEGISRDKDLTKSMLRACGVPVPEGRVVDSAADAWAAASELGVPVVIKPTDGNHARAVFTNLTEQAEIETAYGVAREEGTSVLVERFVPGTEHRVLVVGGRVAAAAKGEASYIVGDGQSTVKQLIDRQLNTDPRRGTTEDCPLNLVRIDSTIRLELERQGLDADATVPQGKRVLISRNGNVAFDVTDDVHPEVAHATCLAAQVVGLDIAGIDLVCEDIAQPLEAQRGAIVEVNAGPGLLYHLKPANGAPRPVGAAIVEHLFPAGADGRIPIVGVTGGSGTTQVARLIAWMLHLAGRRVGLACRDGLYFERRLIQKCDSAMWAPSQRVLMNRAVDAAVIENGARTILAEGLAYDRCQVGVVTSATGEEALGEFDISKPDQLFTVLRTQVDVVLPTGAAVLNADDARVVEMADLCDGEVVYYGVDASAAAIVAHRAAGGRAVLVKRQEIVLASGESETVISDLGRMPRTAGGHPTVPADCAAAAVAAALALGLSHDVIDTGIETYDGNGGNLRGARERLEQLAAG